ncbi:hypothetical protein ACFQU7_02045 [Pseudoroseomonas wenyumeiae]
MAASVGSPTADASWEGRMRACLEARGGEVSARARAAGLAQSYQTAPEPVDKLAFFRPWPALTPTSRRWKPRWVPSARRRTPPAAPPPRRSCGRRWSRRA